MNCFTGRNGSGPWSSHHCGPVATAQISEARMLEAVSSHCSPDLGIMIAQQSQYNIGENFS